MNAILGVVALLLVFVGFVLWECCGWISARAELVKEQARRLKLENDRIEAERTAGTVSIKEAAPGPASGF